MSWNCCSHGPAGRLFLMRQHIDRSRLLCVGDTADLRASQSMAIANLIAWNRLTPA